MVPALSDLLIVLAVPSAARGGGAPQRSANPSSGAVVAVPVEAARLPAGGVPVPTVVLKGLTGQPQDRIRDTGGGLTEETVR